MWLPAPSPAGQEAQGCESACRSSSDLPILVVAPARPNAARKTEKARILGDASDSECGAHSVVVKRRLHPGRNARVVVVVSSPPPLISPPSSHTAPIPPIFPFPTALYSLLLFFFPLFLSLLPLLPHLYIVLPPPLCSLSAFSSFCFCPPASLLFSSPFCLLFTLPPPSPLHLSTLLFLLVSVSPFRYRLFSPILLRPRNGNCNIVGYSAAPGRNVRTCR